MMFDVVTIGSSLVDIFIQSSEFKLRSEADQVLLCQSYGDKVEVDSFQVCTGGGGGNTAVGFARLELRTAVVSELGEDTWAQLVWQDFVDEGVDTSLLIKERKEETGGSVILTAPDGGRTIMVHRGAASMLDPKDIPAPVLAEAGWIHLSSIAGRQPALEKILRVVRSQNRRFSWNPGKAEIKLLVEQKLDLSALQGMLFLVNAEEWQTLSAAQADLHQHFRQIIVTNGKEGGVVFQQGVEVYQYSAPAVEVLNATGAGDSFAVGCVAAMIEGLGLEQQISWGQQNASSVIQHLGAKDGLLTQSMLE